MAKPKKQTRLGAGSGDVKHSWFGPPETRRAEPGNLQLPIARHGLRRHGRGISAIGNWKLEICS
jgi:hypothetical protein